ncbi:hypothetical protein FA13DRAFT_1725575 [Coprinellus micaceus]|uniref:Uncharacterized protein n=1 Tax=Coprinellus micaceus TaxID=71717 RepID=A0A4Y7TUU1_COPMI|nr:hypothetical protein FA13DRAFT_1725575 [Coprinellus micaceus]
MKLGDESTSLSPNVTFHGCNNGRPAAGESDSRKDSKQYPLISPPSLERSDTQLTWESPEKRRWRSSLECKLLVSLQKDADIQALNGESKRGLQAAVDSRVQSEAAQYEEMQQRCRQLEKELEQTRKLSGAFVTTADQYSVADVCALLERLNDEFFQCAMDLSDALLQHRGSSPASGNVRESSWRTRLQESRRLITKGWDEDILVRLEADIAQDDTVMFECLVQNAFVCEAREIIRSFCLENREVDRHMASLWKDIFASQDASVAKNWLAITVSTSRNQNRDHSQLLRRLHGLLVVAGWREALETRVLEQVVHRRLTDMTVKAGQIREVIYTGIRSTHIEIFFYEGGREFDPTIMQDAYEVPERQVLTSKGGRETAIGRGPIVCSTGLGLRCVTKSRRPSSSGFRRDVLLKPKVLLCSTLGTQDDK